MRLCWFIFLFWHFESAESSFSWVSPDRDLVETFSIFTAWVSPSVVSLSEPRSRLIRYPSWNSRMYPVWKDGDPRYKDSWKGGSTEITDFLRGNLLHDCFSCRLPAGGRVIFNVANDSPTLTGAKVTFTISLEFPHTQKVLPNGDVVWAEDCPFNGETLTHMIYSIIQSVIHPFIIIRPILSLHRHVLRFPDFFHVS